MTSGEMRRTPTDDLVTDIGPCRDEKGKDRDDEHRVYTVESIAECVGGSALGLTDIHDATQ